MAVKALQAVRVNAVELAEFPYPELGADALVLRNLYCGICGTDLHGIEGKRSLKFPIIPGHELVAEVAEIGARALERIRVFGEGALRVGDLVTLNPRIVCGNCYYCRNLPGRPEMCLGARTYNSSIRSDAPPFLFGGWAEYMYILPNSELVKLPPGLDLPQACLIEPLACSVGLLDRYRRNHAWVVGDAFGINRNVVVFGVGAIGLLAAACFALNGARRVICVDVVSEKLALARRFGADSTLNAAATTAEERIAAVQESCEGLGADIVVEACGIPATLGEGLRMLRRGGTLFELGHLLLSGPAELDPHLICRNELEIVGNYAYPSSACLGYAAGLLRQADFPYRDLIKIFDLTDYRRALFGADRKTTVKSVFKIA